jgi:protein-disulfide isomerase
MRRRERRAVERRDRPSERRRTSVSPPPTPAWRSPFALISIGAVLVAAVIIVLNLPQGRTEELTAPPTTYDAALTEGETLGAADAPVVIELYSDFQCPYCARFARTLLPQVVGAFVADGKVRIEAVDLAFLDAPGSTESLDMAVAASCAADQDRYWEFHDLLFWNQGRENRGDHDAAFIRRVADAAGLDRTAWDACVADPARAKAIETQTDAALAIGIRSTPTMRINGQVVPGIPEFSDLSAIILGLASAAPSPS